MNKVVLVGNMVRDPDVNQMANGKSRARFTVAINRNYKNKDGKRDADFIDCTAFDSRADFVAKWFRKGKPIGVIGHIQTGKYEKDGRTVYTTDVIADDVEFVGTKSDNEQAQTRAEDRTPAANGMWTDPDMNGPVPDYEDFEPVDDAELPF